MNHLLDHDHSELDAVLNETFQALAEGANERALERLDVFWARLAVHIRAENIQLFPTLLRAADRPPRAGAPSRQELAETVDRLREDHDFFMSELTAAVKQLRQVVRKEGAGDENSAAALARIREILDQVKSRLSTHNALEETRAYRWAGTLLDEPEQKDLVEKIEQELANVPPRLRKQES